MIQIGGLGSLSPARTRIRGFPVAVPREASLAINKSFFEKRVF
jgi:hypothetical protein